MIGECSLGEKRVLEGVAQDDSVAKRARHESPMKGVQAELPVEIPATAAPVVEDTVSSLGLPLPEADNQAPTEEVPSKEVVAAPAVVESGLPQKDERQRQRTCDEKGWPAVETVGFSGETHEYLKRTSRAVSPLKTKPDLGRVDSGIPVKESRKPVRACDKKGWPSVETVGFKPDTFEYLKKSTPVETPVVPSNPVSSGLPVKEARNKTKVVDKKGWPNVETVGFKAEGEVFDYLRRTSRKVSPAKAMPQVADITGLPAKDARKPVRKVDEKGWPTEIEICTPAESPEPVTDVATQLQDMSVTEEKVGMEVEGGAFEAGQPAPAVATEEEAPAAATEAVPVQEAPASEAVATTQAEEQPAAAQAAEEQPAHEQAAADENGGMEIDAAEEDRVATDEVNAVFHKYSENARSATMSMAATETHTPAPETAKQEAGLESVVEGAAVEADGGMDVDEAPEPKEKTVEKVPVAKKAPAPKPKKAKKASGKKASKKAAKKPVKRSAKKSSKKKSSKKSKKTSAKKPSKKKAAKRSSSKKRSAKRSSSKKRSSTKRSSSKKRAAKRSSSKKARKRSAPKSKKKQPKKK